jgi:hypothetical protein
VHDAAQGALGFLQRPGLVALRSRRWFLRRRIRTDRELFRTRFQACRHNRGRRHGCLPRRLSAGTGPGASIGPSVSFGRRIIWAVWFGAVIMGRLGMVIAAEFGEPVAHLGPAVFLGHADVVLADLDLHVKPPVQPGISAAQGVTLLRNSNAAEQWTGRPLRVPGGPCCDRVVECGPVGRCDEPVPDMPVGSECTVSPWGVCHRCAWVPLSKASGLTLFRVQCFHDPHVK